MQPHTAGHWMATVAVPSVALAASRATPRAPGRWAALRPFAASSSRDSGGAAKSQHLVLYLKPGCCLCDGLKEKLHAAFSLDGPYSLRSVDLQVRDISGNPEWERLYQYEIPVLTKILPDGTEKTLPRLSPRLGVELIQKKIAAAFEQ